MGGICSKRSKAENLFNEANVQFDGHKSDMGGLKPMVTPPPVVLVGVEKEKQFSKPAAAEEDFYDGIPRYQRAFSQKSRSVRSTQAAVAKVSEVSSRLSRAGTVGLGKAVEVLDTLGSSMTNFNSSNGFALAAPTKGNEITILAFEIANTIVKGSNLVQSLSKRNIRQLKEEVLPSKGVQHLISQDTEELLRIFASDKREDLKIFSGEVVRFGNRSKDPQWHNLDRYFEKISRGVGQRKLKEEADLVIDQLMTLVQHTAELYHELHSLDRYEQDLHRKRLEVEISSFPQKGDSVIIMRSELKSQRKVVKSLKKKSLWSKSLEEVMEKLVEIAHFLYLEIQNEFPGSDNSEPVEVSLTGHKRLGPAGLDLHYANMIIQIDSLVARSGNMPQNTRDSLYQSLPPTVKSSLRPKLKSFHVKEEMTIKEIKDEMEKTLGWLVPIATNTAKAHHGFGWVGEWANTGSDGNRKAALQTDIMRIETLYHADKGKTESCILEMLLWLNHLATQNRSSATADPNKSPFKSTPLPNPNQQPNAPLALTPEEQEMLNSVMKKKRAPGVSKSQDFDANKTFLRKRSSLTRSRSYSPERGSKELAVSLSRATSRVRIPDFIDQKKKELDIMDRVESQ